MEDKPKDKEISRALLSLLLQLDTGDFLEEDREEYKKEIKEVNDNSENDRNSIIETTGNQNR